MEGLCGPGICQPSACAAPRGLAATPVGVYMSAAPQPHPPRAGLRAPEPSTGLVPLAGQ